MSKLEDLKKKLEEIEATRAAKKLDSDEAIEIKIAENKIKLSELEEQYGELGREIAAVFSPTTGDMVVVKKPSKAAFRLYQNEASAGKLQLDTVISKLVGSCLIYPTKDEFVLLQDGTPAFLSKASNAAVKLAGVNKADIEGE